PQHQNTVTFVDGELYTGTMNNFQGNEPIISRTLGSRTSLKTDSFLSWLHADASFVASFNIPTPPDDEKVYFFFEETAKEFDFFEKLTVSRVARVCKNDVGGDKVLQRKWTTFLKAQLSCTQQGHPRAQRRAPSLRRQAGSRRSSAVCAFSLDAIRRAFDGKYKELNKDCFRWVTYGGPAMEPRPGSCSVGPSSDKALTFVKEHFLMDEKVEPVHNQPLLVQHDVQYTRIAVHRARGLDCPSLLVGQTLCTSLPTDRGLLHKAVAVGSGAHIIEEIRLFEKPEAVRNLLLSPEKGVLYAGCSGEVLRVPLANCSVYATCAECVLARDPYCAWDWHRCRDLRDAAAEDTSDWLQDIATGKPSLGCQRSNGKARVLSRPRSDPEGSLPKVLSAPLNSIVRLPCPRASALASYSWNPPEKMGRDAAVREDGQALLVVVQKDTLGTYECWASENGWRHRVAHFQLRSPGGVEASPMGQRHTYWVQFVSVTVLLSVTLAVAAAVAFFSYHDKLKARSKVQGCSTPEASKASGQEKALLSSGLGAPQGDAFRGRGPCPEAAGSSKTCCVQLDADFQDTDAENNRLNSGLANGSDSGGLRL
uniref:Sema domain-containing protein n=1 Tax=Varanus komodoensis TaxID=61221 RepID=A0A8D2JA56_VARKO